VNLCPYRLVERTIAGDNKMSKKLCKLVKKELPAEDRDTFLSYVLPAKYLCKKCGRVARKKDYLCRPEKIKDDD